jgi:sulfoxide reductase heme-binding subunit YedZ
MPTQASIRSAKPLGTGRGWRRRLLLHHAPLAAASAVVLVLFMGVPTGPRGDIFSGTLPQSAGPGMGRNGSGTGAGFIQQATVATGYLALGLLGLTLLVGPANLVLRRRNPVSSYLRRDVGTWTAIASVVHVILGFQVHGRGQILDYFVAPRRLWLNSFALGNWTGLAALVLVVVLLVLSTDGALRELKSRTWKDLQRLNYTLFALVIVHAFFYGALLRLTSPFTILGVLTVIAVVTGQATGIWLWRRRRSLPRAGGSRRPTAAPGDPTPVPQDAVRSAPSGGST